MTSRDFCFWLQGFFEIQDPKTVSEDQIKMIKKHLHMVFEHEIDPSIPDPKKKLDAIHNPPPRPPWDSTGGLKARC